MLYDASHVAGLIAGGRFQDPLGDGVDVVTFSTYKSYGGPPGGAIATSDPEVAERVFAAVYPGLTANYDAGRLRALGLAATALLQDGAAYADRLRRVRPRARPGARRRRSVRGRRGPGLHRLASPRHRSGGRDGERRGRAAPGPGRHLPVRHTRGRAPPGRVAALRLGTQELVRRGFGPSDMRAVSHLIARVIVDGEPPDLVRPQVEALRHERDERVGPERQEAHRGRASRK